MRLVGICMQQLRSQHRGRFGHNDTSLYDSIISETQRLTSLFSRWSQERQARHLTSPPIHRRTFTIHLRTRFTSLLPCPTGRSSLIVPSHNRPSSLAWVGISSPLVPHSRKRHKPPAPVSHALPPLPLTQSQLHCPRPRPTLTRLSVLLSLKPFLLRPNVPCPSSPFPVCAVDRDPPTIATAIRIVRVPTRPNRSHGPTRTHSYRPTTHSYHLSSPHQMVMGVPMPNKLTLTSSTSKLNRPLVWCSSTMVREGH